MRIKDKNLATLMRLIAKINQSQYSDISSLDQNIY